MLKILVAEHNPTVSATMLALLAEAFGTEASVSAVENLNKFKTVANAESWDAILLDGDLPDDAGNPAVAQVMVGCYHPIIALMRTSDEAAVAALLSRGAQDYLVIGSFDARQLRQTVLFAIERQKRVISELRLISMKRGLSVMIPHLRTMCDELEAAIKDSVRDAHERTALQKIILEMRDLREQLEVVK